MKTDLEKFIELYASVGIKLEPEYSYTGFIALNLQENYTAKTVGFEDCYTSIIFNSDGSFNQQEIWW